MFTTCARWACRAYSTSAVDRRWPGWEVVIGLEVHAQLKSRAKLFSNAWASTYDEQPNVHVAAFDAAFPGTLPRLNSTCVELALRTAIALKGTPQTRSSFDRKHYFYADLPSGYQITQHYAPIATGGSLLLPKSLKRVRINQIQLEQDTAKSTFDSKSHLTAVDLNRAGVALIEIVSEPDMRSPEEAGEYVKSLQSLLRAIGASDCNMEQGSLRCDANVSVRPIEGLEAEPGAFGTRCEIKNLNSVKFMMVAITSEVFRHIELLSRGEQVHQETRGFNEDSAETYLLRSKEDAPDYRYMPDPNLPPLVLSDAYISSVRNSIPELPAATRDRLLLRGLSPLDVDFLMAIDSGKDVAFDGERADGGIVSYFDSVSAGENAKSALNWITHDLYGLLVARKLSFAENPITVDQMRDLLQLIDNGEITTSSAKLLLKHLVDNRHVGLPRDVAKEIDVLALQAGEHELKELCQAAILALPEESDVVRGGNMRVLNKLVGFVMRASKGRTNATAVQETLKDLLEK